MKDMTNVIVVGMKEYRKKTTIRAIQMKIPFRVKTLEGWSEGKVGDWLAEGVTSERYIINKDIFDKTYELNEEPDKYEMKI